MDIEKPLSDSELEEYGQERIDFLSDEEKEHLSHYSRDDEGWYLDPLEKSANSIRKWSGTQWTGLVRVRAVPAEDLTEDATPSAPWKSDSRRARPPHKRRVGWKSITAGVAVAAILLFFGISAVTASGPFNRPRPTQFDGTPSYESPDTWSGTPDISVFDCDELEPQVVQMAKEQRTFGPLVVGIKNTKLIADNQPRSSNGWVIKCSGTAVVSGGNDTKIIYGVRNEGGDSYLSMVPQ